SAATPPSPSVPPSRRRESLRENSRRGGMIGAVTVFCGSSDVVDAKYFAVAVELGEKLAKRRWRLVYGGGRGGVMGAVSRSWLEHGGGVTGVVPPAPLHPGVGQA